MHATIQPNAYVVVKLPSDSTKILQIVPNTYVRKTARVSVLVPQVWTVLPAPGFVNANGLCLIQE